VVTNKALKADKEVVTIAGKLCESGDILVKDLNLASAHSGDIIAIPVCGAYSIYMASDYNALPRPAIVMVKDGSSACYSAPGNLSGYDGSGLDLTCGKL
jgi:diaminopimelate decarboxylase